MKFEINEIENAKLIMSRDADALLAMLSNNKIADTVEIADNVLFDLDEKGRVVCIEIMNVGDAEEINKKNSLLMEIDVEELKQKRRGDKKEKEEKD